ncbi:MAG: peptide-methionine (S)-S-oxide reductase MsrA [Methanomicrobiales archaeon]
MSGKDFIEVMWEMTDAATGKGLRKATFAAGCFWGVEAVFRKMKGVISTRVGYTGGQLENPTYRDVCTGTTGHAEAVEIRYDPAIVSFGQLLAEFFRIHDPTTPDRQGPDYGSQYRSAIFYHDDSQREAAESSIIQVEKSGRYRQPVVTQVIPAREFFEAEEYHQQYFEKNKGARCHI